MIPVWFGFAVGAVYATYRPLPFWLVIVYGGCVIGWSLAGLLLWLRERRSARPPEVR